MSSEHAADAVIVAQGLGKSYEIYARPFDRLLQTLWRGRRRFYREFWALRDVSFTLRRGQAVGILGRNGSGKSTLLQIIAGTLAPTTGAVSVRGRVAALLELGSGFNAEFTGRENVYLNAALLGLSRSEVDARFDEIAAFADIGDFLDQPVKTYSSGMVVRLAFAIQAQVDPDLLIVDEALAVGDALFQKRCYQRIEALRSRGTSLLFVSHDQESVRTLTDHALLLDHGAVRAAGSAAEVLLEYRRLLNEEERRYFATAIEHASQRAAAGSNAATPTPARSASAASGNGQRSAALEFGDLDAQIEAVQVLDATGQPATSFYTGNEMRIRVRVRLHRALDRLNVALRLRNKQGVKVYSWGTLNQDIAAWASSSARPAFWERAFPAGAALTVEFRSSCPLGPDLYEVQAAVSQEMDRYYGAQRLLHWRDEAAFFQVLMKQREYFFGGIADLRMRAELLD